MVKETSSLLKEDQKLWNKVPQVTIFFWIIKIMATTVGETAADFLNFNLYWGLTNTTLVMGGLLIAALYFQMTATKYVPALYWLAVVLISVVGTLITDNLVDNLGVSLETTTIVFSVLLILTFGVWYASQKTLSIHSITTKKREMFYWLTILFTFALGTAAGDLVAESLNWGYLLSAIIFAALIGAITLAYRFKLNAVTAFWFAYILTRPLGASLGDYLSQDRSEGGLELGTTGTSIIFIVIILGLVIYLTKTKTDEVSL
ncbi:COG4705 family protein [Paenibacillus sp. NPDC058367]|uniref:COG4705 family protein n=1 Tax=unclassified Paenibacillus TaxID=185978 RepID=UPI0012E019C7